MSHYSSYGELCKSKFGKIMVLPSELTPKSTTFQQTEISLSLCKRALTTSLSRKSVPFPIDIQHFYLESFFVLPKSSHVEVIWFTDELVSGMGLSLRNLHILLNSPEMLSKRNSLAPSNAVIEIGLGSTFTLTSGIQRGSTSFPVVLLVESDEDC